MGYLAMDRQAGDLKKNTALVSEIFITPAPCLIRKRSRAEGYTSRKHASPTLRTASAHGLCFRGARGRQLRLLMAPPPRKPGQSLGKVRARGGWKELRHRRRSDVGCGVCRGLLRNVRLWHPPLTVLQYLSPSAGTPPSPCMTTRHHYTVALQ